MSPGAYPTKWDCSVGVEAGGDTKHDGLRHVALWRWCGGCGRHETRWPTPRGIVEMLLSCPPAFIPLSGIVSVRDLVTAKPVQSLFAISASERSLHVLVLHTCACAPVFHCRFGLSAAASSALHVPPWSGTWAAWYAGPRTSPPGVGRGAPLKFVGRPGAKYARLTGRHRAIVGYHGEPGVLRYHGDFGCLCPCDTGGCLSLLPVWG